MKIAIIGGGAAGFFSAITVKENYPDSELVIFEKSKILLSKVKISGGGRCNFTNACKSIEELSEAYPRGTNVLKKAFRTFSNKNVMDWFEKRGVPFVIQEDNCVFPESQSSQTIINCFFSQAKKLGINIKTGQGIKAIEKINEKLELHFSDNKIQPEIFDKVIITTGGCPKTQGFEWLEKLNHKIEAPVPSLFTFSMPDESMSDLMGIVVEDTIVSIQGTKIKTEGDLLITHWGMSGPVILKLSSFGARILNEKNYQFDIQVNWVNTINNDLVMNELKSISREHSNKILSNYRPYSLPERLWCYLLKKSDLSQTKKWSELGNKGLNKLVRILTNDVYQVKGRTSFKEEFVTCGGVSLRSIDTSTMQSKVCNNLYFAGEVLDIDGITGGYNFQAAWTTAFIAAKLK